MTPERAQEEFEKKTSAYEILSDPDKRKYYICTGKILQESSGHEIALKSYRNPKYRCGCVACFLILYGFALSISLKDYDFAQDIQDKCEEIQQWLKILSVVSIVAGIEVVVLGTCNTILGTDKTLYTLEDRITSADQCCSCGFGVFFLVWIVLGWASVPILDHHGDCSDVGNWAWGLLIYLTVCYCLSVFCIFVLLILALCLFCTIGMSALLNRGFGRNGASGSFGSGGGHWSSRRRHP